MTTEYGIHSVLKGARTIVSILTIVACVTWLAPGIVAQDPDEDPEMCEFDGHPDVGPCDKTKGYIWEGERWTDDGCYTEIEICCERPA